MTQAISTYATLTKRANNQNLNNSQRLVPNLTSIAECKNPHERSHLESRIKREAWLGLSRSECRKLIIQNNLSSVTFAHWISIPSFNLLLSFRFNKCIGAEIIG